MGQSMSGSPADYFPQIQPPIIPASPTPHRRPRMRVVMEWLALHAARFGKRDRRLQATNQPNQRRSSVVAPVALDRNPPQNAQRQSPHARPIRSALRVREIPSGRREPRRAYFSVARKAFVSSSSGERARTRSRRRRAVFFCSGRVLATSAMNLAARRRSDGVVSAGRRFMP